MGALFAFGAEGIVDIVGASGRQAASNFLRYQTKQGTGFGRSAAGSGQPLVASPFGSGAFSAVVLAAPTSTATIKPWISWRDDGGGEQVTFMANADAGFGASAGAVTMSTGAGIVLSTASGVTGRASVYGFSVDGASAGTIYVDGVSQSTTVTGSGLLSTTARPFYVGSHGGTSAVHSEPIYFIATWKRALSAAEHAAIARNVWGRFAPVRKPVFYSLSGTVYSVSLSESATASDAMSASGALAAALVEAATASNTITAAAVFASALVEAATASESNSATTTRAGALAESVTASDAMSATATLAGALAEAANASDAVSSIATMAAALSEAASASDSIDGSVGAATYSVTLSEAASASDAFSAAAVIAAAVVESVTAGDTVASIATLAAAITEAASASDTMAGSRVMALAITEAATVADAWTGSTGAAVLTAALAESVSAGDVFTALDILARMGIRGAAGVARQAHMRHAQIQAARRRN